MIHRRSEKFKEAEICIIKETLSDEDTAFVTKFTITKDLDLNDNGEGLNKRVKAHLEFYK